MSGATLERLDERTGRLVEVMDSHIEDDKKKFTEVFTRMNHIEIGQAKSGVIVAAVVVVSQIATAAVLGAWIKGMF